MTALEQAQADLAAAQQKLADANKAVLLAQSAVDAAQAAVLSLQKTGSISGFVRDTAGNGLAGIAIYNDANNDHVQQGAEATTVTDAHGAYAFTGLAAGPYKIRAILPAGWTQITPATPTGVDPLTHYYGITINNLASGQSIAGQNFLFKAPAPAPAPQPAPTPAPAPAPSPAPASIAIKGVHAAGDNIPKAIACMESIGAKAARFWGEGRKSGFTDPTYLAPIAKAGIKVCHLLTLDGKPGAADVLSYDDIKRLGPGYLKKALAAGISFIEMNNEVDNGDYFPNLGTTNIIAALEDQARAWREVINDAGAADKIKLIAPSTCDGLGMFTAIVHSKIPQYVDYLNIHIYTGDAKGQETYIAQAAALAKSVNKPLVMTEWGEHRPLTLSKSDPATLPVDPVSWAAEEMKAWNVLKTECAILFRFPLTVIHNTQAGPAGIFNADYSRRAGNLDAFRQQYLAMN